LYEFHELWAAECSDDQRVSLASAVGRGSCIAKVAAKAKRKAKTVAAACRGAKSLRFRRGCQRPE
jgi:hypothetical protein